MLSRAELFLVMLYMRRIPMTKAIYAEAMNVGFETHGLRTAKAS